MTTDPEIRMGIENALAHLYSDSHRRPQADLWYRQSIRTFEGNRSAVQDEALRLSPFSYGDTVCRDFDEFLVDSGKSLQALQLLDRSRARTLQESLEIGADTRGAAGKAESLSTNTIDALAAALIAKESKVYITPTGILYALNFETLLKPTPESFKYWIEDVAVTITISIRILSHLNASATQATKDLLIIGYPVSPGNEFPALGHAAD